MDLGGFAYGQANQMRAGRRTREQALAAIAEQFPELSRKQVAHALSQGLFESASGRRPAVRAPSAGLPVPGPAGGGLLPGSAGGGLAPGSVQSTATT